MSLLIHVAPTGAPRNVAANTTSSNVMVTWDPIACIECNGEITSYTVEFNGTRIQGVVIEQSFTADGLRPFADYTFRVAGVNINGTGPFTNTITISTGEESMLIMIIKSTSCIIFYTHSSRSCVCPHSSGPVHFHSAHLECPSRTQWSHHQL